MKYYGHVPYKGFVEISEQPLPGEKDSHTKARHGTKYRYQECCCRCEECVRAYKEIKRREYERRKEKR